MMLTDCGRIRRVVALLLVSSKFSIQAGAANASEPYFNWDETKHLIAFGDSYTFVQGTSGYPNFSFIGSYLPDQFSFAPETLLSNKIVQNFTATANGGPNWVEYLTGCGLEPESETLPQSCEDMQLWDFAFAGADVSEAYLPLHHDWTVPLVNQTQQFLTWADPVLTGGVGGENTTINKIIKDKSQALVAIWIGINDINDSAKKEFNSENSEDGVSSFPEFYDLLVQTIFEESVQPLSEAGFSNFLFVNLPPLDRTPGNVVKDDPLPNKTMIGWWNDSLRRHSEEFACKGPVVTTMLYDANTFLNGVLDDPRSYGIKDTTTFCASYNNLDVLAHPESYGCRSLNEYFWYNSGHMSSQAHKVMAPDIAAFLKEQSTRVKKRRP